jgi:hypothetical protein
MRRLLLLIVALFLTSTVDAQLRINLNFNIDRQPIWGPTGFDHAEYYYLPDIDVFYNVPQQKFYYNQGGRWISNSSLPSRYHSFDLYSSYKVVVNEPTPYRNAQKYRTQYASYKGRHDQQAIRDSRDAKYYVNPKHPEHKNWVKQQQQEKNKGKDKGRNN